MRGCILFLAFMSMLLVPSVVLANDITIAILPFEEGMVQNQDNRHWWWRVRSDVLFTITEDVTHGLIQDERLKVLERSRIDEVINELRFQQHGRTRSVSAVDVGRLLGARFLLLGTLARLDIRETGYFDAGDVVWYGLSADVELRARLVDVETGVALASFKVEASPRRSTFEIYAPFPMSGNLEWYSMLNLGIGEAVDMLVKEVSEYFSRTEEEGWRGEKHQIQGVDGS